MRFGALEIINKNFMNLEEIISIVNLKKVDDNRFEGQNYHTSWGTVFGGQTLSQSLHAAYQTVPDDRIAHSMHAYFILPGNLDEPVTYEVDKIRNGGSFTTRRVVAFQKNRAIFNMSASFQKKEDGYDHQIKKPNVLTPELLLTDIQQAEDHKDLTPERYAQLKQSHPEVFEFKPVGTHTFLQKENTLPLNHCWFRLKDKIDFPGLIFFGDTFCVSLPTIKLAIFFSLASAVFILPTFSPWRKTISLSEKDKTSRIL